MVLILLGIASVGARQLFAWLGWPEWEARIAPLVCGAEVLFVGVAGLVGALLALGLTIYGALRLYVSLRRRV